MKNLGRTAAILFGVVGLSGVAAALAVGCGGDDTVVGYGPDTGADSPTADVVQNDTSPPGDSGPDTSFHFDAGNPDIGKFALQINQTACAWAQSCCGGPTQFSAAQCVTNLNDPANVGFLFTRGLLDTLDGGGNVSFDQSKASQCLSLIQNLSCSTSSTAVTSAEVIAIRDACYGAITGNIPVNGTGCTSSIECAPPSHCEPQGGGTCVAPYANNDNCILGGDQIIDSEYRCGRAYTGEPGYCGVGNFFTIQEAGTCAPPEAIDASCATQFECASDLCDTTSFPGKCTTSAALITTDLCTAYPPFPDGG
jgi:hypothetical protein